MSMPTLQIREIPEAVYQRLRQQALEEHRSLAQQAIVTLKKGLTMGQDNRARRRKLIEEIKALHKELPVKLPDPVKMIREDRDQ